MTCARVPSVVTGQSGLIAKDNDGLLSDTAKLAVTVRLAGARSWTGLAVDTLNNNLFVVDNRKYSVSAHDTNGFVKKEFDNFSGIALVTGGAISDSIIILRNRLNRYVYFSCI